jgi:hypothetical protein
MLQSITSRIAGNKFATTPVLALHLVSSTFLSFVIARKVNQVVLIRASIKGREQTTHVNSWPDLSLAPYVDTPSSTARWARDTFLGRTIKEFGVLVRLVCFSRIEMKDWNSIPIRISTRTSILETHDKWHENRPVRTLLSADGKAVSGNILISSAYFGCRPIWYPSVVQTLKGLSWNYR